MWWPSLPVWVAAQIMSGERTVTAPRNILLVGSRTVVRVVKCDILHVWYVWIASSHFVLWIFYGSTKIDAPKFSLIISVFLLLFQLPDKFLCVVFSAKPFYTGFDWWGGMQTHEWPLYPQFSPSTSIRKGGGNNLYMRCKHFGESFGMLEGQYFIFYDFRVQHKRSQGV